MWAVAPVPGLALAAAVGFSGVVRGVDYDASMIAEARQRAVHENVDSRVFIIRQTLSLCPGRMAISTRAAVLASCITCLNPCARSTSGCVQRDLAEEWW